MKCNQSYLINIDWYGKAMFLRLGGWTWQLNSDLNDIQEAAILISGARVFHEGMAGL